NANGVSWVSRKNEFQTRLKRYNRRAFHSLTFVFGKVVFRQRERDFAQQNSKYDRYGSRYFFRYYKRATVLLVGKEFVHKRVRHAQNYLSGKKHRKDTRYTDPSLDGLSM